MIEHNPSETPPTEHATALRLGNDGILILGQSGAGKSSLALALLDAAWTQNGPAFLIADDRVILEAGGDALIATCPEPIFGLLEVHGVGIVHVEAVRQAEIHLVVSLAPAPDVPRMPDEAQMEIAGLRLPHITIVEKNPLAPAIVRTILRSLDPEPSSLVC